MSFLEVFFGVVEDIVQSTHEEGVAIDNFLSEARST